MIRSVSAQFRANLKLVAPAGGSCERTVLLRSSSGSHPDNNDGCAPQINSLLVVSSPTQSTAQFRSIRTPARMSGQFINHGVCIYEQPALFKCSTSVLPDNGGHQRRLLSSQPDSAEQSSGETVACEEQSEKDVYEYLAPFSDAVRRVKALSVASLGITCFGAPILVALQDGASMSLGAKAGIAVTLMGFGSFTTGLLHWFASPYARSLRYDRATQMISIETLNFFAQKRQDSFHISEVEATESLSPVSTFQARGRTYYVDPNFFTDKQLLALLSPGKEVEGADTREEIEGGGTVSKPM